MRNFVSLIPTKLILPLFVAGGLLAGLAIYAIVASRMHSYLSDRPDTCVNCHIMSPYYDSWSHSSHALWTNCNDCHVPQDNVINKYAFKAIDGLYHAAVFTLKAEPQVLRPRDASSRVIMDNCIRCHTQLNSEFVTTGMITFDEAAAGAGKACWECHTQVPHTKISSLTSAPDALVPLPASPVPDWLKEMMKKK
ncbi:cytochrome c nitrite reductase small subunit [Parabacteroides sp. OttesenSCG-928-N08]|nr:cytochrome c nitrite reductase small subunit [Parabacteroides sp. OttesenSCG-928-N08]